MKFSFRHKSKGFIYVAAERLLPWQIHNQFRRVNISGLERIPYDQPVLLAANHPTAFIDPVLLGNFVDTPIYFMTRGDIFMQPFARKLLEETNMFPVKRLRDGFSGADRLDETTEYVVNRLRERNTVGIFTEGQHHHDKRILTMQKGIARLAFAAYEQLQQDDLLVIPVGCSYWHPEQIRDVAFFNGGTPLLVKDYYPLYQTSPAQAINKLLRDISDQLKQLAFHIESPEDDKLVERLLTLHRSEHPIGHFPVVRQDKTQFDAEKRVIDWVNGMEAEQKAALNQRVKHYLKRVSAAGLRDDALLNPQWAGFTRWIILLLGLPLFIPGWIARRPIVTLAHYITTKKIQKTEFKTSIWFGVELFAGLLWLLLLILIGALSHEPVALAIALSLPVLYIFSIIYAEVAGRAFAALKALRHPDRKALTDERKTL